MAATRSALLRGRTPLVVALYVLARVPAAAVWLSILLDVSTISGSYGRAGLALAAYGTGVALVAPLLGRLADRFGARVLLAGSALLQLPALLLLAHAADRHGLALVVPAFVAGAVQPPLVAVMRAGWAVLVPDEQEQEGCFTFDSVLGEVIDLLAPLLSVTLNVVLHDGSLSVVAVGVAVTTVAFAVVAPARPPVDAASAGPRGRVVTRPVLSLLVVIGVLTAGLGAVEVGAVAAADAVGHRSWAGLLLGLFTAGSVVGGLLQARTKQTSPDSHLLVVLLLPLAGGLLACAVVSETVPLLTALLAASGMAVAPLVAVLLVLLQATAVPGAETETFTYASTANFLGVSLGSALAGVVGDRVRVGGSSGLVVAGLLVLAAAGAVLALGHLLPATPHRRSGLLCRLIDRGVPAGPVVAGLVPLPRAGERDADPARTRRQRKRQRRDAGVLSSV